MLDWFGRKLRVMQEVKRDERGFTLIELLVVVIIIGILAAIAIPTFLSQRTNAFNADAESVARNAATAAASYATANEGTYDGLNAGELNIIEPSLPAGQNDTYTTYTVVPGDDGFTITVAHAEGDTTYVATTQGVDEQEPPAE